MMILGANEPAGGPWRVESIGTLAGLVLEAAGPVTGRPRIVAIDGRSSSGKTTLARRLEGAIPGATTVHTDDVAWFHAAFDWVDLMVAGVLEPVRRGEAVSFRPPAWKRRGRDGAVEVPPGASVVIVEGVGAGRRELAHLLDAVVYVQSDLRVRACRDEQRVAAGEAAPRVVQQWLAEEMPFVANQRPWKRACVIVAGTPERDYDSATEIVIAPPP